MEEERDFVVFTDDDGNDFELDVIDYFDYKGEEYAVLMDLSQECDCESEEECDCQHDVYIMKIIVNEEEDTEEFVSPADEDMDDLIEIVSARLEEEDGCCCGDEECEECANDECKNGNEGCDCGCHK